MHKTYGTSGTPLLPDIVSPQEISEYFPTMISKTTVQFVNNIRGFLVDRNRMVSKHSTGPLNPPAPAPPEGAKKDRTKLLISINIMMNCVLKSPSGDLGGFWQV